MGLDQGNSLLTDQLRASDIEVIATTPCQIHHLPVVAVFTFVQPEAGIAQTFHGFFVQLKGQLQVDAVGGTVQSHWRAHGDQVALSQVNALSIKHVGQLRCGFDVLNHGRASLHHRHMRSVLTQVL